MRHPLPLLTNEVQPFELSPNHSLLLLQDVHSPFCDDENGWLAEQARLKALIREFDEYFDTLRLVSPNFTRLRVAFREARIRVAYCCLGHKSEQSPSVFQEAMGWRWALDGEAGVFPSAWQPGPDEEVFAKPGWGALSSEEFRSYLKTCGIRSVVVAGAMFDFGIRQTCYELGDQGIGSLVVSDAVVSLTADAHRAMSGNVAHGLTKLRSTAELLDLVNELSFYPSVVI